MYKPPVVSSVAVGHGPCMLTLSRGAQAFGTKCLRKFVCISCSEHRASNWMWSKVNCVTGPAGTSFGNCQEMETHVVLACPAPQQPLQGHPSEHFEVWVKLWLAEEMLDGQCERVAMYIHARPRAVRDGLPEKILEEDPC